MLTRSTLHRRAAPVVVMLVLALASVMAHAADPQPYTISIDDTGDSDINAALKTASLLETLREKAPAGPFALSTRAKEDVDRFTTTLHSFGYYQAKVTITIDGHD